MFEVDETLIPGVRSIRPRVQRDARGSFEKLFHEDAFAAAGLGTRFPEAYVSTSHQGVIRGMHFQLPPHDHDKLVYCLNGAILDVVVDLRVGSPTYRTAAGFELDGETGNGLYIPRGCAHGFFVRSSMATMLYMVETLYAPDADAGLRWNGIDFDWPTTNPVISDRDGLFPALADFSSPFRFKA